MLTDENLRPYYRQLKRKLVCPARERTHFLEEAHRSIANFPSENPQATQADVEDFMGSPESLAETYLASIDQDDLRTYQTKRKHRKIGGWIAVAALLAVALVSLLYLWQSSSSPLQVKDTAIVYPSSSITDTASSSLANSAEDAQ